MTVKIDIVVKGTTAVSMCVCS